MIDSWKTVPENVVSWNGGTLPVLYWRFSTNIRSIHQFKPVKVKKGTEVNKKIRPNYDWNSKISCVL